MDLNQELTTRATRFNASLRRYLQNGEPKILYDAARHLPLAGGKRLRPVIAMIACESVCGNSDDSIPFCMSLELLHNFTLVHDDIMDQSQLRRSMPSVHVKFGEPTAIMAGDLLFAKSFEVMHMLKVDDATFKKLDYLLVNCIKQICEGQQLDMGFEQQNHVAEQEYVEMIRKKTAVLFSLATEGGAIIGGGTPNQINDLKTYGTALGIAFQIWDDYLDISSNEQTLGKNIGNDIRNGKKTLIAVHALHTASGEYKKLLDKSFGNKHATETEVKEVFSLFQQLGSIEYARKTALEYNTQAKNALSSLSSSAAKQILQELADYVMKREK